MNQNKQKISVLSPKHNKFVIFSNPSNIFNLQKTLSSFRKSNFSSGEKSQIPTNFHYNLKTPSTHSKKSDSSKNSFKISTNKLKFSLPDFSKKTIESLKYIPENLKLSDEETQFNNGNLFQIQKGSTFTNLDLNNNKELKIKLRKKVKKYSNKILNVRYDCEDNYLALGKENGEIEICHFNEIGFNLKTDVPISNFKWLHSVSLQSYLISANVDGEIFTWNVFKKKIVNKYKSGGSIFTLDINSDDSLVGFAGSSDFIDFYEPNSPIPKYSFQNTHTSRIYSLKFHGKNPNLCITGGWDERVFIWDLRKNDGKPVNFLYGPMICGESLEYRDNIIVSGSWREKEQIEIWDDRKMAKIQVIDLGPSNYVNSLQFSKLNEKSLAVASNKLLFFGKNNGMFKELDYQADNVKENSFLCIDFEKFNDRLICGDSNGVLRNYSIESL